MIIKLLLMFLILIIAFNNKGIPIFLYHHVDKDFNVTPDLFEDHLKILKKNKMNTITVEQLLNNPIPYKSALITLDDGYRDNYTIVFPLLKKYNMRATIFLNTAYIGIDKNYMNWEQIKEMYESKLVNFQCHSHRHNYMFVDDKITGVLTGKENDTSDTYIYGDIKEGYPVFKRRGEYSSRGIIIKKEFYEIFREYYLKELKDLDKKKLLIKAQNFIDENKKKYFHHETKEEFQDRITKEFLLNKEYIEKNLNKTPLFFCWPWGHRSKEAMDTLKSLGVRGFVTTKKGTNFYKPNLDMIKRVELRNFTKEKFQINLFICKNLILGKLYSLLS